MSAHESCYQLHDVPAPDATTSGREQAYSRHPHPSTATSTTTFQVFTGQSLASLVRDEDAAGLTDAAIDRLYDAVNQWMVRGDLARIDGLLRDLLYEEASPPLLVAALTITTPVADRLQARQGCAEACEQRLRRDGVEPAHVLRGLV